MPLLSVVGVEKIRRGGNTIWNTCIQTPRNYRSTSIFGPCHMNCDTTTHGFRASFRTWADNRTICETEVKEMALAHALGDKTEEAYSRSDLFEKRRHLMQAWNDYLTTGKEDVIFIGISDPN